MGRGKSWSREESEAVVKAWRFVSNTFVSPRDQGGKHFIHTLYHRFLQLAPPSSTDTGRWTARSPTAVKTHFDSIAEEVSKFNRVLRTVINLPTTVNVKPQPDILLRAVIAVHTRVIDIPQLDFNNLPQAIPEWKMFSAWRILAGSPRFAPKAFLTWVTDNANTVPSDLLPLSSEEKSEERKFARPAIPSLSAQHGAPVNSANSTDPARHFQRVEYNAGGTTDDNAEQVYKKRRTQDSAGRTGEASKTIPGTTEAYSLISNAIHRVADGLNAVAVAQAERNVICLLNMPHVEITERRKVLLDLLLEKHIKRLESSCEVGQTEPESGPVKGNQAVHHQTNGADAISVQPSVDFQEPAQLPEGTNPSSVTNEPPAG
ncbi:unnamed protein product [Agarophyton chilense]|eukprot:gb/GEZJ01003208.1/.p1 GENE.gb/GEZJ01003208.1/~~gb/GEZJ01003208.1/.p1  ORF type:complete len:374 (+),score=47.82 gb/GEZJ01003208.1/:924-2045(+)